MHAVGAGIFLQIITYPNHDESADHKDQFPFRPTAKKNGHCNDNIQNRDKLHEKIDKFLFLHCKSLLMM